MVNCKYEGCVTRASYGKEKRFEKKKIKISLYYKCQI